MKKKDDRICKAWSQADFRSMFLKQKNKNLSKNVK